MLITEKGFYRTRGGDVAFVYNLELENTHRLTRVLYNIVGDRTVLCLMCDDYGFCKEDDDECEVETNQDLVELIKPYSEDMLK